jgi:hypothetical protein
MPVEQRAPHQIQSRGEEFRLRLTGTWHLTCRVGSGRLRDQAAEDLPVDPNGRAEPQAARVVREQVGDATVIGAEPGRHAGQRGVAHLR